MQEPHPQQDQQISSSPNTAAPLPHSSGMGEPSTSTPQIPLDGSPEMGALPVSQSQIDNCTNIAESSNSKVSGPLDEFTLFPNLATELQIKIRGYAALQGRLITVNAIKLRGQAKMLWADTPIPGILHACHLARKEEPKVYKLLEVDSRYLYDFNCSDFSD